MPVPFVPSEFDLAAMVGDGEVSQHMPREVISFPPSSVTYPPQLALVIVTEDTAAVESRTGEPVPETVKEKTGLRVSLVGMEMSALFAPGVEGVKTITSLEEAPVAMVASGLAEMAKQPFSVPFAGTSAMPATLIDRGLLPSLPNEM